MLGMITVLDVVGCNYRFAHLKLHVVPLASTPRPTKPWPPARVVIFVSSSTLQLPAMLFSTSPVAFEALAAAPRAAPTGSGSPRRFSAFTETLARSVNSAKLDFITSGCEELKLPFLLNFKLSWGQKAASLPSRWEIQRVQGSGRCVLATRPVPESNMSPTSFSSS